MAVIAVWKCDRDGTMFDNKKDAEEHDKMLELAANITRFIEQNIPGIDERASEKIGLLFSRNRETLVKACKGKPEALLQDEVLPIDADAKAGEEEAPEENAAGGQDGGNAETSTKEKAEKGTEKKVASLVASQ